MTESKKDPLNLIRNIRPENTIQIYANRCAMYHQSRAECSDHDAAIPHFQMNAKRNSK